MSSNFVKYINNFSEAVDNPLAKILLGTYDSLDFTSPLKGLPNRFFRHFSWKLPPSAPFRLALNAFCAQLFIKPSAGVCVSSAMLLKT